MVLMGGSLELRISGPAEEAATAAAAAVAAAAAGGESQSDCGGELGSGRTCGVEENRVNQSVEKIC